MNKPVSGPLEKEIEVLETIHHADEKEKRIVQRDIAHIVGVSIGMTNTIIKRLTKKGLLTVRRINSRNIRYALSPEGMRMLSEKSYRYFKRTIKNVVIYKEKIGAAVYSAAELGYDTVILVGESDLDFIVEHFCFKQGIGFRSLKAAAPTLGPYEYPVYSEKIVPPDGGSPEGNTAFYLRLIV